MLPTFDRTRLGWRCSCGRYYGIGRIRSMLAAAPPGNGQAAPSDADLDEGLLLHRLPVGKPSQNADCFRAGARWAASRYGQEPAASAEQVDMGVHCTGHVDYDPNSTIVPDAPVAAQAPKVEWMGYLGDKGSCSIEQAAKTLKEFYDVWPGGLEEIEAAIRAAKERSPAAPTPPAATAVPSDDCDDVDAILRIVGLDPERCRTEGGALNVGRVRTLWEDVVSPAAQASGQAAPSDDEIETLARDYCDDPTVGAIVFTSTRDCVGFARALLSRYGQAPAASAEPVELVEAVTKAILFEDSGSTADWRDNTNLGQAAIRAYATAVRAAIAPHRAEQVALMQQADKDGRAFNAQGHSQAIQAIDVCLASLAAPVAAQAQPSGDTGELPALDERTTFDQWFCRERALPMDADTTQYDEAFLAYRAWQARAALAVQASCQAPAASAEPVPVEIERLAINRYRPVPAGALAYKVVAGDGSRSLFSGTKDECQIVARKLTEAFLDGAHVAINAAPVAAQASAVVNQQLTTEQAPAANGDALDTQPAPADVERLIELVNRAASERSIKDWQAMHLTLSEAAELAGKMKAPGVRG